ncbi:MAG: hypothetical protein KDD73_01585 [Anaerolineales bacterium]|nr:hypothetical protein [Anaerolineales bacterium]MCB9127420.1 hypothetical protein [Ardenticatenales bacterium]
MNRLLTTAWKVVKVGGWFPLLVFALHVVISRILHLYLYWPTVDIPMHFAGGLSIAYFVSCAFQTLPRYFAQRSRTVLLELLLIATLTTTAAVCWEFAEFAIDQLLGSNVQVSLANTMQDMAMGMLGATFIILIRSRHLNVGFHDLREIASDWSRGAAA